MQASVDCYKVSSQNKYKWELKAHSNCLQFKFIYVSNCALKWPLCEVMYELQISLSKTE